MDHKVMIHNYDLEGKKVLYGKHDRIDDPDTLFVFQQEGYGANGVGGSRGLISATEFKNITSNRSNKGG